MVIVHSWIYINLCLLPNMGKFQPFFVFPKNLEMYYPPPNCPISFLNIFSAPVSSFLLWFQCPYVRLLKIVSHSMKFHLLFSTLSYLDWMTSINVSSSLLTPSFGISIFVLGQSSDWSNFRHCIFLFKSYPLFSIYIFYFCFFFFLSFFLHQWCAGK